MYVRSCVSVKQESSCCVCVCVSVCDSVLTSSNNMYVRTYLKASYATVESISIITDAG